MAEDVFQEFLKATKEISSDYGGLVDAFICMAESGDRKEMKFRSGGPPLNIQKLTFFAAALLILELERRGMSEEAAFRIFFGRLQDEVFTRRKEQQSR